MMNHPVKYQSGFSYLFQSKGMAIFIFIVGLLSFLGAESYKDFYLELSTKFKGEKIDYSTLTDFCGWTGAKFPWETDFEYDWRRVKNMFSALCAMLALSNLIVGGIVVIFLGIFIGKVEVEVESDTHGELE